MAKKTTDDYDEMELLVKFCTLATFLGDITSIDAAYHAISSKICDDSFPSAYHLGSCITARQVHVQAVRSS